MTKVSCTECGWTRDVKIEDTDLIELRSDLCEDGCRKTLKVDR